MNTPASQPDERTPVLSIRGGAKWFGGLQALDNIDFYNQEVLALLGVHSLSGGQQHSLAIGRGVFIGSDPRLIIMDEPTAGLGVKQSREVLQSSA